MRTSSTSSAEQGSGEVVGVIVALGGQTPLKLADVLPADLVLGTSAASIDLAEDRERWNALCAHLEIPQPAGGTAVTVEEAMAVVERVGYPVLMRQSYVLDGWKRATGFAAQRGWTFNYRVSGLVQRRVKRAPTGGRQARAVHDEPRHRAGLVASRRRSV